MAAAAGAPVTDVRGASGQMAGWFHKTNAAGTIWAKRWFVLDGHFLRYYDEPGKPENGNFDLSEPGCHIRDTFTVSLMQRRPPTQFILSIQTQTREVRLAFLDAGQRDQWIAALRKGGISISVKIKAARQLKAADLTTSDPYVKIMVYLPLKQGVREPIEKLLQNIADPEGAEALALLASKDWYGYELARTEYQSSTLNPVWNYSSTITVDMPQIIVLEVFDHDTVSADDPLGAVVALPEWFIPETAPERNPGPSAKSRLPIAPEWWTLHPRPGDKGIKGQLNFSINYVQSAEEQARVNAAAEAAKAAAAAQIAKETRAAVIVQSSYRRHKAQQELVALKTAHAEELRIAELENTISLQLQAIAREKAAAEQLAALKAQQEAEMRLLQQQNQAALMMQCCFRRLQSRKRMNALRAQHAEARRKAAEYTIAIKTQNAYRRKVAQRKVAELRRAQAEARAQRERETRAALRLQCMVRRRRVEKRIAQRRAEMEAEHRRMQREAEIAAKIRAVHCARAPSASDVELARRLFPGLSESEAVLLVAAAYKIQSRCRVVLAKKRVARIKAERDAALAAQAAAERASAELQAAADREAARKREEEARAAEAAALASAQAAVAAQALAAQQRASAAQAAEAKLAEEQAKELAEMKAREAAALQLQQATAERRAATRESDLAAKHVEVYATTEREAKAAVMLQAAWRARQARNRVNAIRRRHAAEVVSFKFASTNPAFLKAQAERNAKKAAIAKQIRELEAEYFRTKSRLEAELAAAQALKKEAKGHMREIDSKHAQPLGEMSRRVEAMAATSVYRAARVRYELRAVEEAYHSERDPWTEKHTTAKQDVRRLTTELRILEEEYQKQVRELQQQLRAVDKQIMRANAARTVAARTDNRRAEIDARIAQIQRDRTFLQRLRFLVCGGPSVEMLAYEQQMQYEAEQAKSNTLLGIPNPNIHGGVASTDEPMPAATK